MRTTVMLPSTAATNYNYSTGMVTLNATSTKAAVASYSDNEVAAVTITPGMVGAAMGFGIALLTVFLILSYPSIVVIVLVGMPVLGAVIGTAIDRRRRTTQAACGVDVTAYRTKAASDVVVGEWITRPTRTIQGTVVLAPAPAHILNSATHAAQVLQNVRIGNTAAVRITTTAGTLTVSGTAEIGVVELADPALNDFTYQPRG